jgi:hypothetical protein
MFWTCELELIFYVFKECLTTLPVNDSPPLSKTYKLDSSFSAHNFVHSFSLSGTRRYYLGCIANSPVTAVLNIT